MDQSIIFIDSISILSPNSYYVNMLMQYSANFTTVEIDNVLMKKVYFLYFFLCSKCRLWVRFRNHQAET